MIDIGNMVEKTMRTKDDLCGAKKVPQQGCQARAVSVKLERFFHGVVRSQDDLCGFRKRSATVMASQDDLCGAKRFPHRLQKLQKKARVISVEPKRFLRLGVRR